MKRIVSLLAGFCLLIVLFGTPALAQVPTLPHAFWGSVEINNSPAPIGTSVEARGTGVETGIAGNPIVTTEVGKYGSPARLIVQGDIADGAIITFYVKGVSTGQTADWHSGEIEELPLTATIAAPAIGGGGGGGPAPDTTAPSISNVVSCYEGVTETTADICWTTNELSTSQVEYWASPGLLSTLDETLVTDHHIQLTGLTPATTYNYKTMSKDRAGNLAVSPEYTFTTLEKLLVPEPAPPAPAPPAPAPPAPPPAPPPEVAAPINWPVVGGIIAGVVVVGLLIFFLVRRRAY